MAVAEFVLKAIHDGILASHEALCENQKTRLTSLYIAASRALRPPIAFEMALGIFTRWAHHGAPMLSLDGTPCCSRLTPTMLREWISGRKTNVVPT